MKHISLETAKALKAAGFPQEFGYSGCYFVWHENANRVKAWSDIKSYYKGVDVFYAAPTEGELLDAFSKDGRHGVYVKRQPNTWRAAWEHTNHIVHAGEAVEALTALWIEVCGRKDDTE